MGKYTLLNERTRKHTHLHTRTNIDTNSKAKSDCYISVADTNIAAYVDKLVLSGSTSTWEGPLNEIS